MVAPWLDRRRALALGHALINQPVFAFASAVTDAISESAGGYSVAFRLVVAIELIASVIAVPGHVHSCAGQFARR